MRHQQPSTALQDYLLSPSPVGLERLVAWVAPFAAMLAGFFAVVMLFACWSLLSNAAAKPGAALAAGVAAALFAAMAWFLATTGMRMRSGRFNDQGSMASPATWLACCVVFLALGLLFAVMAVAERSLTGAIGATSCALLALLSYGAWSHFRHLRVRGRQTPR